MKLLPSRRVLCTPYNHAPCHFMQSHIRKVYACLAVTCHLHLWRNDRGLLRATVVTRGWNGYRNKSQHRKLTLEKKILPPLLQGFEPATFRSRVRRSNHWAIPRTCHQTPEATAANTPDTFTVQGPAEETPGCSYSVTVHTPHSHRIIGLRMGVSGHFVEELNESGVCGGLEVRVRVGVNWK